MQTNSASLSNAGFSQTNSDPVILTPVNLANQEPIVYVGVAATISVTLGNNTGGQVTLLSGTNASVLTVYMPQFYTADDINAMQVTTANWAFAAQGDGGYLTLTWTGSNGYIWAPQTPIVFEIQNATSSSDKTISSMVVNFSNFNGSIPNSVMANMALQDQPIPGNANLSDVLQITLDNQGSVFISNVGDPIQNTLFLNFKNSGSTPLFSGSNPWTVTPQVVVSFVYGSTAGALAQSTDRTDPGNGSAWNINGGIYAAQGNNWQIQNPDIHGIVNEPQWTLNPVSINPGIIGTETSANISFDFNTLVSITPVGHTQMYVQFTNFPKDDSTLYNDELFVIDIVKQNPPPTRGLLNFFSQQVIYPVNSPTQQVAIPLRWAMFNVASVNMITAYPGISPTTTNYPNPLPLAYDSAQIIIPGTINSTPVTVTLQAFDGNGGYLNSLQFTSFLQSNMFFDTRDGKAYPVIQVGNQLWMAQNLDYAAPSGSAFYNNNQANEATYGRLYTVQAASTNIPGGWRLPSQADWNNLIAAAGTNAYAALIAGGSMGLNAQLGGYTDANGVSSQLAVLGYYWSQSPQGGSGNFYASFSSRSSSVSAAAALPTNNMLSVRYVRDIS